MPSRPPETSADLLPPQIRYTVDLDHVNVTQKETRYTVTGLENTLFLLVPPKGCHYGCAFCSLKNRRNPDFPVASDEGGAESAFRATEEIGKLLAAHPETDTLKLFNDGNILYGTERGKSAELNEKFWPSFLSVIENRRRLKAVEIELRVDEFVGPGKQEGRPNLKGILRDRLVSLDRELKVMRKRLRCILPLEYVESGILSQQSKFSRSFTASKEKIRGSLEHAVNFMKLHGIEWLAYAMLGGRLKDRSLTSEEAVASAAHTSLFALKKGAREVIINSQYLDPIQQWEAQQDKVPFYVPNEADFIGTLRLVVSGLLQIPKIAGNTPRARLTVDKEDIIAGTIGPVVTPEFHRLIDEFNNAPDQVAFFEKQWPQSSLLS